MKEKDMTGKTFYYLLDTDKVLHVCSDGLTVCGLDTTGFSEALDKTIEFKLCEKCKPVDVTLAAKRKTKKATFETKAELVEAPTTGTII